MTVKAPTQREVAKLAGVSYPTVNRALSGSDRVSQGLRRHILEVANSMGYRKNMSAASLVTKRTYSLGLVSKHLYHSFWGDVFKSLECAAREAGYHVVVCHRDTNPAATSASEIRFLLERQVDGLIVVPNPNHEDATVFKSVTDAGVPLLFVDEMVPGAPGHYLGCQGREGARDICQYLINLGHRRICHVTAQNNSYSAECRKRGYLDAMRSAGLKVDEEMIIAADGWDYDDADVAVSRVLAMSPRPTAIFAGNDPLAIQLSMGLRRSGLSIPGDISLAGFAGMQEGAFLTPALTSVKQPSHELGRKAIEIIMKLIRGDKDVPVHTEMPTRLLLRDSCAPPTGNTRQER